MSATFYRQLTPDSAPYMSFGFHTYVTVDSEWTADAKLPRSCDKCPVRCRSQSLCCEALNVGLQARRRGGKPKSSVPQRSKLSSLGRCWRDRRALQTDSICRAAHFIHRGGQILLAVYSHSFTMKPFSIELPEVVVYGTHQVLAKRIRVGIAEATRMGSQMIAEALDHPKTTSMSWLVPRTPHEHFVSYRNMILTSW